MPDVWLDSSMFRETRASFHGRKWSRSPLSVLPWRSVSAGPKSQCFPFISVLSTSQAYKSKDSLMVESRLPMPGVRVRFPVLAIVFLSFSLFAIQTSTTNTQHRCDALHLHGPNEYSVQHPSEKYHVYNIDMYQSIIPVSDPIYLIFISSCQPGEWRLILTRHLEGKITPVQLAGPSVFKKQSYFRH